MPRIALAMALSAVSLLAQGSAFPSPIAVTGDASQIFFVSNLPGGGSDNVYKYIGGNALDIYPGLGNSCGSTQVASCVKGNFVTGLQVSSDGETLWFSQTVVCYPDCLFDFPGSVLVTSSGSTGITSAKALSRNGRFLLQDCASTCSLTDLVEGGTQSVPFSALSVANDGTVVSAMTPGMLLVWNPQSGVRTLAINPPLANLPVYPIIDALASHAAVWTSAATYVVDLLTGSAVAIPTIPTGLSFYSFSDSGARILLIGNASPPFNQAFLANIDGTNLQQVTWEPTGIASLAISSDASILIAVNGAGDLLRYHIAGGTRELMFNTPPELDLGLTGAPGSAFIVRGTALADGYADAPAGGPLPTSLGGVQVLIDGEPIPLIEVGPNSITCQLPWELTTGAHNLAVNRPVSSPFAANQVSLIAGNYPTFVAVTHEDWTPITLSQPAQEGEILHFYMTGLGPVTPPIPTGEITPIGPLFTASSPNCYGVAATFETLFVGLAPGLAGIYQMDTRINGLATSPQPKGVGYECGSADTYFYAQAASN